MLAHLGRSTCVFVVLSFSLTGCTCASPQSTGPDGGGSSTDGGPHGGAPDSGQAMTCIARTCTQARANCGPVGDGCGGEIQCGTCTGTETCGGGGVASQCGSGSTCIPYTCETAGADCGPVADGCGHTLQCGTCANGAMCGAGGVPSVCPGTSSTPCTNLCMQQLPCPAGTFTTVTGVVHAPTTTAYGQADPLYNAIVYVPNAPVAPFTPGVACDQCGATLSGSPLVTTTTAEDGSFTLRDVPVGTNIPLVVQLGRWRRQVTIPTVAQCVNTPLSDDMVRMPRTHLEGDIPLIAMATGSADPMECILQKIGIDNSEFTDPSGGGRVQVYNGNGATIDGSTPSESTLVGSATTLNKYDMVIFACQGSPDPQPTSAEQTNVINYTNLGGRVFATHYSYNWLYNIQPFQGTAAWDVNVDGMYDSVTGTVDQTFARGKAFAQWLVNVGASTTLGTVKITQARQNFDSVTGCNESTGVCGATPQLWLYDSTQPLQYTFNTPVGAAAASQCGEVLYSDFHATGNAGGGGGGTFPGSCGSASPMTPQEKVLEFLIFDLSSCVPTGGLMKADSGGPHGRSCGASRSPQGTSRSEPANFTPASGHPG